MDASSLWSVLMHPLSMWKILPLNIILLELILNKIDQSYSITGGLKLFANTHENSRKSRLC